MGKLIAHFAVASDLDTYIYIHTGCILHSVSGDNIVEVNTFTRKTVRRESVFTVALLGRDPVSTVVRESKA